MIQLGVPTSKQHLPTIVPSTVLGTGGGQSSAVGGHHWLGYGLALLSTAIVATTFIISKIALRSVSPLWFSIYWYGAASVYAALYTRIRPSTPLPLCSLAPYHPEPSGRGLAHGLLPRSWRPLLVLGATTAVSALLWFTQIQMADPALVSFFGNLSAVFTVVLGVTLLGERLRWREGVGAVIILAGALLITFRAAPIVWLVFGMAVGQNLLHAGGTFIAKRAIATLSPGSLTLVRATSTSLFLAAFGLFSHGRWVCPPANTLALILVGAVGGPFLSYVLFYRALAVVNASTAALIGATRPLFVLLYGFFIFQTLPLPHQIAGGLLSIAGVALLFSTRQCKRAF